MLLLFLIVVVSEQYKLNTITEASKQERLHIYEEKLMFKDEFLEAIDVKVKNSNSTML